MAADHPKNRSGLFPFVYVCLGVFAAMLIALNGIFGEKPTVNHPKTGPATVVEPPFGSDDDIKGSSSTESVANKLIPITEATERPRTNLQPEITSTIPTYQTGPSHIAQNLGPATTAQPAVLPLSPEWEKFDQLLLSNFAKALNKLTNAITDVDRLYALNDMAKVTMAAGLKEAAEHWAKELLELDKKTEGEGWKVGSGQAVHDGNIVLGRLAVEQGRLEEGKDHLLAAAETPGSPVLGSFGPNMTLAKALLEAGERDTVLEYFERCRKFWPNEKLSQWSAEVQAGKMPDFGANLLY